MNKNKNVSIWRGDTPPPSKFHLWLKNNKLYHNDGIDWIENEIDNASNEGDGLMSKEDKERLDNLVYDGLDSNDQNRALSANLGNVLLGKIETIKLSAYKVKGSVENISDIPLVDILLGDVYNILNSFYINNKKYPEGTNVVWTGTLFDPLGGTVDFKDYSTTEQIEEIVTTLENNVNNSLDNLNSIKSDKTYVDEQLATKANTGYVNEQLATKADITYVDNKVSPKADTTYVDNKVSPKADKTYVDNKISGLNLFAENATYIRTADMQYMGVAFDRNGYNNGTYDTSVDVSNLSIGDTFNYTEGYDSRGNISDVITIYSGETIVTSANGATAILSKYGPGIMQVLAKSREDGICIYKCEWPSSEIYLYGYGAEYQVYKKPYVLELSSVYEKVDEISSNYVDAPTFIAATNDLDTRKADKTEVESKLATKADKTSIESKLATKVDKVSGKGLSTNDYTTADKNLVATISSKADKTYVDTQLETKANTGYVNAQVEILTTALETKVNKVSGKNLSTNDYTTEEKNLVATIPSKATEEYVDENIALLAKQRTSFVTPCFSDCDSTHEAKCKSITLAGGELGFGFKSIFSVTIKIAENLSLLNQTPTYLHIKDLFGNSIGVSMNGVKQMQNLGKYATWFFDSAINTSGMPIVLSLHTTNVASSASDSNLVKIIAHVNQSEGMKGCNITDENGTSHTNWTPALGINVVNLAAIYPQIKELQKYRMAYATSELPDISTTGHKANIKEIRINQNVMGISLVNSVSIMVASDNAYNGALELRIYDINNNLIATSNNTVNLSQNLGKYVTWYFTPFQLNTDAIYKFSVWNSGASQVMRIHVASGKSEGVTCFDQNNSPHTDYCPAFGINISAIFADDLNIKIKNLETDLNQRVHRDNIDTIISEYIESNPINTDKVYWESEGKTQTEFNSDLLSKYITLDNNLQESVNMLNAKVDGGSFPKDYEATLKYKIGRFDEWSIGGGHSFYADANLSYNTIQIELTKGLSIIIQPAFSCILVSVDGNWGTCLATFSKNDTTPYNVLTTGTYYISLFDSSGYPVSNDYYVATVITSYSSKTTYLENKIYLLEERIAALEQK